MYGFVNCELHMFSSPPLFCASQLNSEVKLAKKELKKAQTIMQLDELKCRKRVLRRWEGRKGKKKGGWRKGRRGGREGEGRRGEKGGGGRDGRRGGEGQSQRSKAHLLLNQ